MATGDWSIDTSSSSLLATLSSEDRRLFVQYGLGRRVPVPFRTIHEAFEHHARLQPETCAVEHLGDSITYRELDVRSDDLARMLRDDKGVRPGARVMILAKRSISYAVAILAVLKAGGKLSRLRHLQVLS